MYTKHIEEFAGKKVVQFEDASAWQGPDVAYRVGVEWEDEHPFQERLAALLAQPGIDQLTHLVIGFWDSDFEGADSSAVVQSLVEQASRLSNLTALFLGDVTYEEQELSWIVQSNVTPLLNALPKLQWFQIRGSSELSFERTSHAALKTLIVESGGLPRSVLRQIALCDFPALEHLELHLGEENYGWDGTVDDLQPFLSGERYPNLRYLGLRDSNIVDEIAAMVVNAPITRRIEVLDLSLGNMSESGARSLMLLPRDGQLKRLDVSHHYIPEDVVAELKQSLPFEVVANDPQDMEDEWRPIMHAE